MPELPEVETVRRVLEPQLKGLEIVSITADKPEVIAYPTAEEFCRQLTGQTFLSMSRRGKFLIVNMNSGDRAILHLRMTGCLLVTPPDLSAEKHTHVIFHLSNGNELRFSDTRRFGRLWLVKNGETDIYSGIDKLGAEPFDAQLNAGYLKARFGKRRRAIKECLLDQSVIAGIGNIYSDEILYSAGICPARPANSLKEEEWERLAAAIPRRLEYFIEKNSITAEKYLEGKGKDYRNTPFLQVYGHADGSCPSCGGTLVRAVIGGRSSVYCPNCQR
ncbi:DNA-formamidopyrimidine glycosylase [Ruminococcus sp. Marseille-P6503]|uniref:DNA-formamidopyrimidine glycosylase n=1 Tax=Ruminococcus sp. Marseille-P6503 TaxID=2364796 RepID=UPI000F5309A8|nr:DNA-formamidopyrimidine glycosylase [Ruminococcus sp. Marseille-P6503]